MSINQTTSANSKKIVLKGLLWLFVVIVIVTPRITDLNVFFARDESTIWRFSNEFTAALWSGNFDQTLTKANYPGIPMFLVQALSLKLQQSLSPGNQPLATLLENESLKGLATRRMVASLFISLLLIGAVWFTKRLFGWSTALLAAIFLGLDPFSLSETRVLRLEMLSSSFTLLSLLTYFVYLTKQRRRWLFASGLMAGLAVSSKSSAGLMVPYIWLLLLLELLFTKQAGIERQWTTSLKRVIGNGLLWATGAIAVFWAMWPAMWVIPFTALEHVFIRGIILASETSAWHGDVFFWGQLWAEDPGPLFYPVALAFRTTPLTWLGLIIALITVAVMLRRRLAPSAPLNQINQWAASRPQSSVASLGGSLPWPGTAIILLLIYVVMVVAGLSLALSKADRFLLIAFPQLNLVSAIGFGLLFNALAQLKTPAIKLSSSWLTGAGLLLVLAIQLLLSVPYHPYYFTFWNPLLGGGQTAARYLPMGAGEGIDLAMEYLNAQPDAQNKIVVCGNAQPQCQNIFKGQSERSAWYANGEWITADYASFYISRLQRQEYPDYIVEFFQQQSPLYEAKLNGATYMWVYNTPPVDQFAGAWNDLAGLGRLLGYSFSQTGQDGAVTEAGQPVGAEVWWVNEGAGADNLVLRWLDQTGYEWGRAPVVPVTSAAAKPAVLSGTVTLPVPSDTPPGLYFLRFSIEDEDTNQILGDFTMPDTADSLTVLANTQPTESPPPAHPVGVALAPEITLLGHDGLTGVLNPMEPVWLPLLWQADSIPGDYQVQLRLLDAGGNEAARWQSRPVHDSFPTQNWSPDQIVRDVWALQIPPALPSGRYRLDIALRPAAGEEPLTAPVTLLNEVEVAPQPVSFAMPSVQNKLDVTFGDHLTLLGYDLFFDSTEASMVSGNLSPVFYWLSQVDVAAQYEIHLFLRSASNNAIVGEWRLPLGTDSPKTDWRQGEIAVTSYYLPTTNLPKSALNLELGLWRIDAGRYVSPQQPGSARSDLLKLDNIHQKITIRLVEQ